MVMLREFRVIMPLSVDEYPVGQLFSVAMMSKNETGGGEGVEILVNEPFENEELGKGQYTHKIYHLAKKVPKFLQMLAPKGSMEMHEKAWNAYPYCRTVITNPEYMKDNFMLKIETWHKPDKGEIPNVHNLPPDLLAKRDVVLIDIGNDPVANYNPDEDPSKFKSSKTGRGLLTGDWQKTVNPFMCAYKLVTIEFKWWGLQNRVESYTLKAERRLFLNFHRQLFCSLDDWYGLTMDDIRDLERKIKDELNERRLRDGLRGTVEK